MGIEVVLKRALGFILALSCLSPGVTRAEEMHQPQKLTVALDPSSTGPELMRVAERTVGTTTCKSG